MAEIHYALTEDQLARLKRVADSVETLDRVSPRTWGRRPIVPSRIIVGILTNAVSATTSLIGKPKVGTLNVYSFSSTGTEDTGVDETVYNFAATGATTDRWTIAELDAFNGKFVITAQFCS